MEDIISGSYGTGTYATIGSWRCRTNYESVVFLQLIWSGMRTSLFELAASASLIKNLTASHAHFNFPRGHSSGSPFLRGANTVGHNADLSLSDVGVRAAVRGTATMYGSGRLALSGRGGGVGCVEVNASNKLLNVSPLRIRFRWTIDGLSRPADRSHL